ncbi:MAG TPA: TrkA family potassium uptake protein, partial [Anaerolineae bacterium]|nr:TrkA family potassium uptake protein [Anaerolineae bacterium]
IVGGGKTGSFLAEELYQEGQAVTVIEKRPEAAARLKDALPAITVVAGDGDDPAALEVAGIRSVDVVVAATGDDEDNLVVCLLARQEFRVRRTVARVNNPKNEWLFTTGMGVDFWVSQSHVIADLLREELAALEIATLMRLADGEVALVEDILQPTARVLGRTVDELLLPANSAIVAIVRGTTVLVPRPDVVLQAGDRVIALARAPQRQALAAALQ